MRRLLRLVWLEWRLRRQSHYPVIGVPGRRGSRLPQWLAGMRVFWERGLWERRPRRDEGGSKSPGATSTTSPRRLALAAFTACALLAATPSNAEPISVTVEGAVLRPGTYTLPDGARLHDAAVAGQVRADAWFLGAALLRQSAIEPQQRLKAGVLFDLASNRVHWLTEETAAGVELATRLQAAVEAMPVTGRVPAQLDPLQQLALSRNDLLETGDRIVYPLRASQVRVTGAVQADCLLAFDPTWQPVDYLAQCAGHELADPSFVHVIQPDGHTQRLGVALWNREPAHVAVGAVLYVPVDPRHLASEAADLNEDYVALLATQLAGAVRVDQALALTESALSRRERRSHEGDATAIAVEGATRGDAQSELSQRGRRSHSEDATAMAVGGATRGDVGWALHVAGQGGRDE